MSGKFSSLIAIFVFQLVFTLSSTLLAAENPQLTEKYSLEYLKANLIPREQFKPYPTIENRDFWDNLPNDITKSAIEMAEKVLKEPWPVLRASVYLDFYRNGNRRRYEKPYFERRRRLSALMLAELIENEGRFTDDIIDGTWLILEETSWTVPAHLWQNGLPSVGEQTVALFTAESAALMSWVDYLVGPILDTQCPDIRKRIAYEVDRQVLTPCAELNDFWWMAIESTHRINNWNPWVNSNWIVANLLMEKDPARRVASVWKSMRSVDKFIDSYKSDGGCDEGPSYWGRAGGSLFDYLEMLRSATGDKVDMYGEDKIRQIGRFVYRAHISGRYYVNFADAPAMTNIPANLVFEFGERIGDDKLKSQGAYAASLMDRFQPLISDLSMRRNLGTLVNIDNLRDWPAKAPYIRGCWLDGIQVMYTRDKEGSDRGFYLAAKGGHNYESHNHNDVGNFIVYYDGLPVICDAGVGTYTKKTFSDQRYDIWTMQSAYHNLPTINGRMQKDGIEYAAKNVSYSSDSKSSSLSLDISAAYTQDTGVESWKREIKLERGKQVVLNESFELKNRNGELSLNLLTSCRVDILNDSRIGLTIRNPLDNSEHGKMILSYPSDKLVPLVERIEIDDERLSSTWGNHLNRIVFKARDAVANQDSWQLELKHE